MTLMALTLFIASLLNYLSASAQAGSEHVASSVFQAFPRIKLYSWSDPYESYRIVKSGVKDMTFRLKLPTGYTYNAGSTGSTKYPVFIFLHGKGEASPEAGPRDNEKQLLHGGQNALNAVTTGNFPGFILFPQIQYSGCATTSGCQASWNPGPNNEIESVRAMIDELITNCDADPDRIYISGLSGGGQGDWYFLGGSVATSGAGNNRWGYPEYFAAAHVISAANALFTNGGNADMNYYKHVPLKLAQGGLDGAPTPSQGNALVTAVRSIGGNIQYDYFPTNGHNTWDAEFTATPAYSYFTWFLTKKKTTIWVENGQTSFCSDDNSTIKLGVTGHTANPLWASSICAITNYEWSKDGVVISTGPNNNEISVPLATGAGSYTVRIFRPNLPSPFTGWSAASDPVVIDRLKGPSNAPASTITANGRSTNFPALDGSTNVTLAGPLNQAVYLWTPGGATTQTNTVSSTGTYTLKIKNPAGTGLTANGIPTQFRDAPQGCFSLDSNPICITSKDAVDSTVPAPPVNFFASSTSLTSVQVNWDDRSSNENGFELYRTTTSGSGYVLISIIPATSGSNPQVYNDINLQANTTYYYRMRAVNCNGGSSYTTQASATTGIDILPPTAPSLVVGSTSRSIINLSWTGPPAAFDAVGVYQYDLYQNGILIATLPSTTTAYSATGLTAFAVYNYVVKARDLAGNVSPPSNQVTPTAVNTGLFYSYYHNTGIASTTQIVSNSTLMSTGIINNFLTTPKTRTTNYAFIYDGYINIPTTGNYTFYLNSDDGSQLFINNVLNVNFDGLHGTGSDRAGTVVNLSAGTYPIKVAYFQATGGASLTVKWKGPGIALATIPDAVLKDSYTPPVALVSPDQFVQGTPTATYNQINLQWRDKSSDETGFEIWRAATATTTAPGANAYQVVTVRPAGAGTLTTQTWSDTGLSPSTYYWYKIRAINATSASTPLLPLPAPNYIQTLAAPTAPSVPTGLTPTVISATQINLNWNTTANATGYEIQRSSSSTPATFVSIAVINTPTVVYNDLALTGHSTVYYRIRALGLGGNNSAYSAAVSATTTNRIPVLTAIADQSIFAGPPPLASGTLQVSINAADSDSDPITLTVSGISSSYYSLSTNNYGLGTLTFSSPTGIPVANYTITIQAFDGLSTVQTAFTLYANANKSPVVGTVVVASGSLSSPTSTTIPNLATEEGRTTTVTIDITDPNANTELLVFPYKSGLPPFVSISNLPSFATATLVTPAPPTNAASNSSTAPRQLKLTFTPTAGNAGIYDNITLSFNDNASPVAGLNVQIFSLTVAPLDVYSTISINFTPGIVPAPPTGGNVAGNFVESSPWNNTPPTAATIPTNAPMVNLKDDQSSTVRFVTFNTWTGGQTMGTGGSITLPISSLYTKKVRESYFARSGSGTSTQMKFQNLNPALQYKATFYGASTLTSGNSITRYTVAGASNPPYQELNTLNNIANTVTTSLISPVLVAVPASGIYVGDLTITIGPGGSPINTGNFYINAVVLTATYPQPIPPDAPTNLTLTALDNTKVNITWQDNSYNEASFEVWRGTSPSNLFLITSTLADKTAFNDTNLTGRTTYYYKIVARNQYGTSETPVGVVTTLNGLPALSPVNAVTVRAGLTLQTNIGATDPDGDHITFSVLNLPNFATLVDNGNNTGFIRFAPQISDIGTYTITLKGVDAFSGLSQLDFTVYVIDAEIDELVNINFTGTGASSMNNLAWNDILLNSGGPLKNNTGSNTGLGGPVWNLSVPTTFSTLSATGSSDNLGVNTGTNSGVYPDKVTQSFWATGSTTTGSSIQLSNLNDTKRYNIELFGSRNEFYFADAIYTIGTTSKTLKTSKNTKNTVRFSGIQSSGGIITITVKQPVNIVIPSPNPGTVVHRQAALGAMVVEEYTLGTTPRRPSNLVAKGASKTSITLTWNDNSADETAFEIYRATSQSGPFSLIYTTSTANVETYTDATAAQNTAYIYKVRAIKGPSNPSAYSNDAIASSFNEIIYVNLNSSVGAGHLQAAAPWNNTATPAETGIVFGPFKNDTSPTPTTVDLEVLYFGGGGNWNTGLTLTPNAPNNNVVPIYPAEVMQNYYFFIQYDVPSQFQLRGLDVTKDYELVFLGNEWSAFNNQTPPLITAADYTVGTKTISQFNGLNRNETASFLDVKPETDGTIPFQIKSNDEALVGVWNSLVIRSYTPLSASFDTEAPSVPQNLVASNITDIDFTLSWSPSSDNVGVAGYEVFQGSTLVATVAAPTTLIGNLQPLSTYNFSVRSYDIKGNRSGFSNALQVTTLVSSTQATRFYSKGLGPITDVATWGTNPLNGSGQSPLDFTSNNQEFNLTRDATVGAPWVISGSNAKLVVNDGVELIIDAVLTSPVEVGDNATVIVNAATSPQFGTLSPTSTITFSGNPNAIPGANYGNLTLTGASSSKSFSTGTYLVSGDLNIDDGVALSGSNGNSTTLSVSGNLTLAGNATMPSDNQLFTVDFNSGSTQTLTANELDMKFFQLKVSNNSQLNIVNTGTLQNTLTLGTSTGGGLIIETGSVLDLGKNSLVIEGQGSINPLTDQLGQLKVSKADITVRSTGTQISNLYFVPGSDILNSINLDASASSQVNLNTHTYIQHEVSINNGKLNSAGNLVLLSDVNGTARVAAIHNSGAILGSIEYQRYLDAKGRVYRYLSTPIVGTKVADWINSGFTITGSFTGIAVQNPSVYYYDEINGDPALKYYVPFPAVSDQEVFIVGKGYAAFQFGASTPGKLRLNGATQQGDFTYTNMAPNPDNSPTLGWNLLGNPYASPIKWKQDTVNLYGPGVDGTVYVRNNPTGTFKVWNKSGIGDPDFRGIIAQGQAFWVHTNNGFSFPVTEAFLRLKEDIKYDSLKAPFYRSDAPRNNFMLTLSSGSLSDRAFVHFAEKGTNGIDSELDAVKLLSSQFNLATQSANRSLAINSLPAEFCMNSIWLDLTNTTPGSYKIAIDNLSTFDYAVDVSLRDHFTGTESPLSEASPYTFSITSDVRSFGKSRFELVVAKPAIRQDVAATLQSLSICEGSGGVKLNLSNTQAGALYEVLSNETVLQTFTGNGEDLKTTLSENTLRYGVNTLKLSARFSGCSSVTLPAQLDINYIPTYQAVTTGVAICEGETADLTVSGAPAGAVYKWYNSNTDPEPLLSTENTTFKTPSLNSTTHYFVNILQDDCEHTNRTEVTVQVDKLAFPTILIEGDQLISNSKKGNQWNLNDSPIEGAIDVAYLPKSTGVYSVTVTDGACEETSAPVEFVITSLEQSLDEQLTLHPNPVKDRMIVRLPSEVDLNSKTVIYIYNASGMLVSKYKKQNVQGGIGVGAEELSAGLYLMVLEVNGKVIQKRFVKE